MSRINKLVLGGFFLFALLGSFFLIAFLPAMITNSLISGPVEFARTYSPHDFGLEPKELRLKTEDGLELAAWEVRAVQPKAVLVFLGPMLEPSVTAFWGHAAFLKEKGYASILLEMRAHGQSQGEQISLGYREHLDVLAAWNYLQQKAAYQKLPVILFGVGMGGAAALNAAGLYPQLAGVISIAAYSSWGDLFSDNLYFSDASLFLALAVKPFAKLYTWFKFGWAGRGIIPQRQIANLGSRPVLLMHSREDGEIPFVNLERLMESAPPQAEAWARPGSEHWVSTNFLEPEEDREYTAKILQFLENNF
ncbi:MAG: hypothetical protein GX335_07155 [Firmicutes bacterium]|nr:hypothetical protein [Bacillota bacterium]